MKQVYTYNPTGLYISLNAEIEEGTTYNDYLLSTNMPASIIVDDSSVEFPYNVFGEKSGEHINFTTALINVDDVIDQVNNDQRFPNFGKTTLENVKNGDLTVFRELKSAEIK